MGNWNGKSFISNQTANEFFNEIDRICLEYNVSISHEDKEGAFEILKGYNPKNMKWFRSASLPGWTGEEVKKCQN